MGGWNKQSGCAKIGCVLTVCFLCLCADQMRVGAAQQSADESRDVYYNYMRRRRAAKVKAARRPPADGRALKDAKRYIRRTQKTSAVAWHGYQFLGITFWRLRSSSPSDEKETQILDKEGEPGELTPIRIEAGTKLATGDRVRLSVESPLSGYLYVVNYEQYANGQLGEPNLIFPNLLTRGGNNRVRAGILIDLPANGDQPSFFRLKPSRQDQVAEMLMIIVSPRRLDVPPLGRKRTPLTAAQVEQWVDMPQAQRVEQFELEGGAGQAWTKEEKAASSGEKRELEQDDPGPQTIYRVAIKPGVPLLVTVLLRYRDAAK